MFANLLIIVILSSGGHSSSSKAEENNLKIEVAGAYNNLVRWRKNDVTDLLPDVIIIHIMGGDYQLLDPHFTEILETEEKLRTQIESTNEVPMRTQAASAFYSLVVKMITDFGYSITKGGTCGSWVDTEHLFPSLDNFFSYIEDSENKDKTAYIMIKTTLKKFGTEKGLKQSLNALKKMKKILTALDDTRKIKDEYLERTWTEEPAYVCKSDLVDFKALVALEDHILEHIPHDDCNLISSTDKIDLTFEGALKILDISLEDEELINDVIHQSATQQTLDDYKVIKLLTKNPLALLSITTVRDIISGFLTVGKCESCNCKRRHKALPLHHSVNRIRNIFPSAVNECKDNWVTIIMRHNLFFFLIDIQGIETLFEAFAASGYMWYYKPYVGISYSEMPVKHGIWWTASHILPFDTCERFYYAQILRDLLEKVSRQLTYRIDRKAFDQCGILPSIETHDSLLMIEKKRNMIYYDMIRKFNPSDISIFFRLPRSSETPFGYESALNLYFKYFRDEELSLDPEDNENMINTFTTYWIEKESIWGLPAVYRSQANTLRKSCPTCEFYSFFKAIFETYVIATMNYDEGRIHPFSFEQERYSEERSKVINQDTEALSGCPSKRDNFITLVQSDRALLSSELMQKPDAFKLYLGYLYREESFEFFTPQSIVYQIDKLLGTLYEMSEEQFPDGILHNYLKQRLDQTGKMLTGWNSCQKIKR